MSKPCDQQFFICARLSELGFASEQRVRLYGEEFYLVSDPVPDGDGFAVEGIACGSVKSRRIRIPLSIVHVLRQERIFDMQLDLAA